MNQDSQQICEDNKEGKNHVLKDNTINFVDALVTGQEPEEIKSCLPPCQAMSISIERTLYLTKIINYGFINLQTNEVVAYIKDVYSYDIFDLLVDLGSSLGLWLGLSAVSVFDCILALFRHRKLGI